MSQEIPDCVYVFLVCWIQIILHVYYYIFCKIITITLKTHTQ